MRAHCREERKGQGEVLYRFTHTHTDTHVSYGDTDQFTVRVIDMNNLENTTRSRKGESGSRRFFSSFSRIFDDSTCINSDDNPVGRRFLPELVA